MVYGGLQWFTMVYIHRGLQRAVQRTQCIYYNITTIILLLYYSIYYNIIHIRIQFTVLCARIQHTVCCDTLICCSNVSNASLVSTQFVIGKR